MDRMRAALAREKEQLLERWERQLRAAADAGFALDGATAEVLPKLLEAADRALHRRFRAVGPGMPAAAADAQRAAIQCSLLRDFLSDAMVETVPEMSPGDERTLGDALAHAAVEVLVRRALEREHARRRRGDARLTRLAHALRNSATAATLALDLLRRRGALAGARAVRLLESNLSALREELEDALLDQALSADGLRTTRVRLAPMLEQAQSSALELGAAAKNVRVVLLAPESRLSVNADPRLVRPAVRGVLRAALHVARSGAIIHLETEARRNTARVAFAVSHCRKLHGNRLPDLPALLLARRAAKANGGSLRATMRRDEGCEFHLALPRSGHR
jgi:signal transduction histidine kinase